MIEYPTKVLLAADGSEDSARAVEVAVALSGKTGAELHVVHVGQASSPSTGTTVHSPSLPTEPYESVVKRARKLLERQVEQIRESGGGTVAETHLSVGSPPYEVVGLSDEIGADLIVVGSGRPRAVRRAVSGTIRRAAIGAADYIVRSAHCPVLVVRGDGILRSVVPHPDARDAAPEGEPEAIGDRREEDRL